MGHQDDSTYENTHEITRGKTETFLRYFGKDFLQARRLCNLVISRGHNEWPAISVCFFFEPGEKRGGSGTGACVVRVDTYDLREEAGPRYGAICPSIMAQTVPLAAITGRLSSALWSVRCWSLVIGCPVSFGIPRAA